MGIYGLQDIFNLLPDVTGIEFNKAMQQVSNDQMLIVYLASMIKSVIALHNLIDNKLDMNKKERDEEKKDEEARIKKQEEKEAKRLASANKNADAGDAGTADSKETKDSSSSSTSKSKKADTAKKQAMLEEIYYAEQMKLISCRTENVLNKVAGCSDASSKLCTSK